MTEEGYKGISLPDEIIEAIDKKISDSKLGYRSRAEFVVHAVRKELQLNGFGGSQ